MKIFYKTNIYIYNNNFTNDAWSSVLSFLDASSAVTLILDTSSRGILLFLNDSSLDFFSHDALSAVTLKFEAVSSNSWKIY